MSHPIGTLQRFASEAATGAGADNRRERLNRRILRRLSWMHFANDGYQAAMHWFVPVVAMSSGFSAAKWGVLAAVHLSLGVILGIPSGMLARRWGGLRLLSWAMGIYGLSLLILSTGTSEPHLWSAMLLAGIGFGVFHPVGFSLVAQLTSTSGKSGSNAAATMGRFAAIGDVGRVLISWLIAGVIGALGFQIGMAIAGSIAIYLSIRFWRRSGIQRSIAIQGRVKGKSLTVTRPRTWNDWNMIFTNRSFGIATAIGACDGLTTTALILFAPVLLAAKGYDPASLSIFVGTMYTGSLFGKVGVGIVADRWGHRASLVACQFGLVLVTVGLALNSLAWIDIILVSALGLLTKGCLPIALAMTAGSLPREQCEIGFGINQTVTGLASTLSPTLFGLVAILFGLHSAAIVLAGMSFLSISVLTSLALKHRKPNSI